MLELRKKYKEWDDLYGVKIVQLSRTNTPVNFKESLQTPIHRWLAYKEGFSPSFVKSFIEKYRKVGLTTPVVFDPFGGVGTTVLSANTLGCTAFSTDVNPLGNFASNVKNHHYTAKEVKSIETEIDKFLTTSDVSILVEINNETVRGYFHTTTFEALLKARSYFCEIKNKVVKDIFVLALLSVVETISTHRKDGNGLKKKKKLPEPVDFNALKSIICDRLRTFICDIKSSSTDVKGKFQIFEQSCILPYKLPHKADLIITSPPYANCFDYSKVYMNELWVGGFFDSKSDQQQFRENSISSHVHYKWKRFDREFTNHFVEEKIIPILQKKDLWNKSILNMLPEYFADLGRCLYYISQNLSFDATVGFVVGNSVYAGVVVSTDLILANIAESIGFEVESIEVYRRLSSSSQQMSIIADEDKDYLRESLVILKWKKK